MPDQRQPQKEVEHDRVCHRKGALHLPVSAGLLQAVADVSEIEQSSTQTQQSARRCCNLQGNLSGAREGCILSENFEAADVFCSVVTLRSLRWIIALALQGVGDIGHLMRFGVHLLPLLKRSVGVEPLAQALCGRPALDQTAECNASKVHSQASGENTQVELVLLKDRGEISERARKRHLDEAVLVLETDPCNDKRPQEGVQNREKLSTGCVQFFGAADVRSGLLHRPLGQPEHGRAWATGRRFFEAFGLLGPVHQVLEQLHLQALLVNILLRLCK